MIDQAYLKTVLHYDPETGVFTWLVNRLSRAGKARVGERAGSFATRGYRQITIDQERYKEHRLAWFYMTGSWPAAHIDHINRTPGDNRFANLREATNAQNSANRATTVVPASGLKGAYLNKSAKTPRWFARISVRGEPKSLGSFDTPEEAHQAYLRAAHLHYGDFAPVH